MPVLTGGSQPIPQLGHWSQAEPPALEEKVEAVFGDPRLMSQLLWESLTSASPPLSQAAHKAVLDVSEEGTEAAAATTTKLIVRSKDSPSSVISFNQPFLILLSDRSTESILFLGKVENPTKM